MKIGNAVIESAELFIERDMLTAMIYLDLGDSTSQGFGGRRLFYPEEPLQEGNYTGRFVYGLLRAVGVYRWSDLPGKSVRCKWDKGGMIVAIGHILYDNWFEGVE